MAELEAAAAAQRPLGTAISLEPTATVTELVDGAIATAESTVDSDAFIDAASNLMFHAYVDTETNNRAANAKAREFVENTEFDAVQRQALNEALLDEIDIKGQIELARREKETGETKYKPVYKYLTDNNLLPLINATTSGLPAETAAQLVREGSLSLTNLPDSTAREVISANPELIEQDANNINRGVKDDTRENPATRLATAIRGINLSQTALTPAVRDTRIAGIQAQWDALPDDLRNFVDETGTPLSDYFEGDVPKTVVINRKLRVTKQQYTDEQVSAFEADENAEPDSDLRAFEQEESGRTEESWNAWNEKLRDGNFSRADGTAITQPLPLLRIRTSVNKFLNRLAMKPRVSIYKDQADLKAKNPRLHQRAADSRPEGDFDSVQAAGFAFGDGNVIIFSDYIATEQQLNFVLAHETMGHFGLRGIIPVKQFDALMERIYQENPGIQGDVDAAMMARDMPRAEAVEEYLADFAAQLDTSIMARVWNAIKGALNNLGIEFGDESARYFVSQARRYVRDGGAGVPFEVSKVMQRLYDVEYGALPVSTGRFAAEGVSDVNKRVAALMFDKVKDIPATLDEALSTLKNEGISTLSSYDKFKAKFLSLANFRAFDNPGLMVMNNLIESMTMRSMSIKVDAKEKLADVLNKAVFGKFWGIKPEQIGNINRTLYAAQRYAVNNFEARNERSKEPLYRVVDGVLVPNQPEIDRLAAMGRISFEQMRDGFTYKVDILDEQGKRTVKEEKFDGIPDLTEDSLEWTGYTQIRNVMNGIELDLARAHVLANLDKQRITFNEIAELTKTKKLQSADKAILNRVFNKYYSTYSKGLVVDDSGNVTFNPDTVKEANDFLVAFNQALIGKGTDRTDTLIETYFAGKGADDLIVKFNEFKSRFTEFTDDTKFTVQNRMKQLLAVGQANDNANFFARRNLATGYTPLFRPGKGFQLRVEAVNAATGKRVLLSEFSRDQLIYSQFEKESDALKAANVIKAELGNDSFAIEAINEDTGQAESVDVRLVPKVEDIIDGTAKPPELNLNEFVQGLLHFDVVVTPKKLEQIIKEMTAQNSSARKRLDRQFVPGASPDGIRAISRHIEGRASTIAKTELRPQMAELLNLKLSKTQKLWNGDPELLQQLKENSERVAADPQATIDQKNLANKEYDRYRYMYNTTNPSDGISRANRYISEAARTASFLDGNRNVDESDFGSGKLVSSIRTNTSLMLLGASVATGMLNIIGVYTNGIPYLASYNDKNGFGGGFGVGPAVAQLHIAAKDVGVIGMNPLSESSRRANTAMYYDGIAKEFADATPDQRAQIEAQYNLKEHEARFIAREIRSGVMIPAQSNSLTGTSRGTTVFGAYQKFIDGWMLTFNLTEQSSRRSMGLASYRLEFKRQYNGAIADGLSETQAQAQAEAAARRFAVQAIKLTMGEYSVLTRPPAWRSGLQSFIYMYKVFPTTSVQVFASLSRNGRLGMIAGLMVLSGMSGLPFAEDLEDVIDTLAQKLGFKVGSVRAEAAKFIDSVVPGASPLLLTGFANSMVAGNIGIRTSLGNMLPGTGMFLAGANTNREFMDIAGPAASAFTGAVKTLADAARLPFSDQVSVGGVLREAPVSMVRAFADAYAYSQTGAIIDRRGYVVSRDMNAGTIAARMLGFYPNAAADQYSAIRVSKRIMDYQRDVSSGFRTAWINAMQTGDRQRARSIEQSVAEWNKGARGTALEIRNFQSNARRALREAQRPAGERTLRSAPRAARRDIERLSGLLGY